MLQLIVFLGLTTAIALLTWWHCRSAGRRGSDAKEYFLAGGGLSWVFVAGSLTLTNINTDTLVGWNGNQMLLVLWWELFGVAGLLLLAWVFLPIYYRLGCTTVTELLERRYRSGHLRATVATLFLLGNVFVFLPVMLYTSALFLQKLFGLEMSLMTIATLTAVAGAAYAIFGGLRAVAVSDTYSGVLLFGMAALVAVLALDRVDWSWSEVPAERLTMIGGPESLVPWPILFTGMILWQIYYWSTNQTITQRALAATSLREAQKGCYAAAVIRATLVPLIVVVPGLCAYQLHGPLGDATYGTIVGEVLPTGLTGAFAAAMVAATMTSFNSTLNSSAALYVCDLHQRYFNPAAAVPRLSVTVQVLFAILGVALVPVYIGAESIIQLIQELIGVFSIPILSAFVIGLLFDDVDARAVIATLVFGAVLYWTGTAGWSQLHAANPESVPHPLHFVHVGAITLLLNSGFALLVNRWGCGRHATLHRSTRS
ncbi:sodium:solute symporter family transporter [Synoicihabitans lomoniglobus]|uniref:Sodium/solute symporter n=1 Tax=Synoicihabitans lomoniglobus TaxID=2909285 RepID=A0AAE9ZVM7_9BACT|nr:sodium/solute symporter [Opitutaceae bacterium LMO-M01]WED64226.1 sodium/solute symporter [Opitutaceae bacterium LMO-M01]